MKICLIKTASSDVDEGTESLLKIMVADQDDIDAGNYRDVWELVAELDSESRGESSNVFTIEKQSNP